MSTVSSSAPIGAIAVGAGGVMAGGGEFAVEMLSSFPLFLPCPIVDPLPKAPSGGLVTQGVNPAVVDLGLQPLVWQGSKTQRLQT